MKAQIVLFVAGFVGVTILDWAIVAAGGNIPRTVAFTLGTTLGAFVGIALLSGWVR